MEAKTEPNQTHGLENRKRAAALSPQASLAQQARGASALVLCVCICVCGIFSLYLAR